MGTDVKVRSFQVACATSGSTQDLTLSGFGTVKAVMITGGGATANGTAATHARNSVGIADGTSEFCLAQSKQHTTDYHNRGVLNDKIFVMYDPGATTTHVASAGFNSFITDGVRIDWDTNSDAAYLLEVTLFGGADLSVVATSFLRTAAMADEYGVTSITGLSFAPNGGIFIDGYLGNGFNEVGDAGANTYNRISIGFSSKLPYRNAMYTMTSEYAQANGVGAMASGCCFGPMDAVVGDQDAWCGVYSYNSDGIDLRLSSNAIGNTTARIFCLLFDTSDVGCAVFHSASPTTAASTWTVGETDYFKAQWAALVSTYLLESAYSFNDGGEQGSGDIYTCYSLGFADKDGHEGCIGRYQQNDNDPCHSTAELKWAWTPDDTGATTGIPDIGAPTFNAAGTGITVASGELNYVNSTEREMFGLMIGDAEGYTPDVYIDVVEVSLPVSTTGTFDITGSLGGKTCKGAILIAGRADTADAATDHAVMSIGVVSSAPSQYCFATHWEDAVTTEDVERYENSNACIDILDPVTATSYDRDASAKIYSLGVDKITLDLTTAPSVAYKVMAILFAGDDVDLGLYSNNSLANNSYNHNVSRTPDLAFMVSCCGTSNATVAAMTAGWSIPNPQRRSPEEAAFGISSFSSNYFGKAVYSATSWNPVIGQIGAWENKVSASGRKIFRVGDANDRIAFLNISLGGLRVTGDIFQNPTSPGNATVTPRRTIGKAMAAFSIGSQQTGYQASMTTDPATVSFSIGAAAEGSGNECSVGIKKDPNVATHENSNLFSTKIFGVMQKDADDVIDLEATVNAWEADGDVVLDWTNISATQFYHGLIIVEAPASAATGAPYLLKGHRSTTSARLGPLLGR